MQLFYAYKIDGNQAFFSAEESAHCQQVLRKRLGEMLHFTDGQGNLYSGNLLETNKKGNIILINEILPNKIRRNFWLHLAIAPPKSIDRLEWFLEKATEMGVDEITPLLCQHSERDRLRLDRLQKIVLSAMKQSLQTTLPKLNESTDFRQLVTQEKKNNANQKFIAYCNDESLVHLKKQYEIAKNVTILIGPEGDFSPQEIAFAKEHSFVGCSLGDTRLRTETAGLVACQTVHFCN